MHSGSHQLYMLASVVVWHVRKRKHCKARHSTALRRAVELAKLNGAGDNAVRYVVHSAIRSWV